jgi:hypothetical protein
MEISAEITSLGSLVDKPGSSAGSAPSGHSRPIPEIYGHASDAAGAYKNRFVIDAIRFVHPCSGRERGS